MSHIKSLVVGASMLVALDASAKIQSDVKKSFNVQPGGNIQIETSGGDVVVHTGNTQTVDIVVQRIAHTDDKEKANEMFGKYSISASQSGNTVTVVVKKKDSGFEWFNWSSIRTPSFTVIATVPKQFNAKLETSGGDIRLADLVGSVHSDTSGGDIEIANISGTVKGSTSGGDISLTSASGTVSLSTSGGDITVGRAGGMLDVSTSGGDIIVRHAAANAKAETSGGDITIQEASGTLNAHTSGGDITASFSSAPKGLVRLDTSGGGVRVTLPANAAFELDAETSGGDVSVDFPITIKKKSSSMLQGSVNGGGVRVELSSSSGDVKVMRK